MKTTNKSQQKKKQNSRVYSKTYKLVVLGECGVGKSALVIQFVTGKFVGNYDPTIEDSYRKEVDFKKHSCILDILDTTDEMVFGGRYLRTGQAFVIAFDITDRKSFEKVEYYQEELLKSVDSDEFPLVLVGNKIDVEEKRNVNFEEAKELSMRLKCPYIETSAKNNINVAEVFHELLTEINKNESDDETESMDEPGKEKRKKMICNLM
eukprot:gene11163-3984_t